MVTFYRQTYGELSRFFLALRDGRLIGAHCPRCKQVMVPAVTWHCPSCNFSEMVEVDLPHRGVLAATAPITIFPSASFIGDAPFCRGYVDVATDAPVATFLPARLRTTTGLPRPGLFVKGVELKLVFEDTRIGRITDIFFVPMREIPAGLRDAEAPALVEAQLHVAPHAEGPADPGCGTGLRRGGRRGARHRREGAEEPARPERSRDADSRHRNPHRRRRFHANVKGGGISVAEGLPERPDFTVVADDPAVFTRWVADSSLTDAAVEGSLWLPHKEAFGVLPILDSAAALGPAGREVAAGPLSSGGSQPRLASTEPGPLQRLPVLRKLLPVDLGHDVGEDIADVLLGVLRPRVHGLQWRTSSIEVE